MRDFRSFYRLQSLFLPVMHGAALAFTVYGLQVVQVVPWLYI